MFVLFSNEGVSYLQVEPENLPVTNYILIEVGAEDKINCTYKYGENELKCSLADFSLVSHLGGEGETVEERVTNFTRHWSESDLERLHNQQSPYWAYLSSVATYLTFYHLIKMETFQAHSPLGFVFSPLEDQNPFSSKNLNYYLLPCKICSIIGQNLMGNHYIISVLNHIQVWGGLYKDQEKNDYLELINETMVALSNYVVSQMERTNVLVSKINFLEQRASGEQIDVETRVADTIRTNFQKYLSEVYRGYEQVLTDNIDDMVTSSFDKHVEHRLLELKEKSTDSNLEERVGALESQYSRLLAKIV